jgi:phosphodiester glycosidase
MLTRRSLLRGFFAGAASAMASIGLADVRKTPSPEYVNITFDKPDWQLAAKGFEFARQNIQRNGQTIETVALLRIDPAHNQIRVFSAYEPLGKTTARTIEEWQKFTGAAGMVNSAQYMADPYYMPCAPVICDGRPKGPKSNPSVRGMFVAEPLKSGLPRADLLDFDFDHYVEGTYSQGVQHWPILVDRAKNIKVKKSGWQANRTVVAKDTQGKIVFLTTEGNYFTLYNLALFLKEDNPLNIHTAMNLDGGSEASMIVKTKKLSYVRYGPYDETQKDAFPLFSFKRKIPGVIGVFPR